MMQAMCDRCLLVAPAQGGTGNAVAPKGWFVFTLYVNEQTGPAGNLKLVLSQMKHICPACFPEFEKRMANLWRTE